MHCASVTNSPRATSQREDNVNTETTTALTHTDLATGATAQHSALGNVVVAIAGGTLVLAGFVTLFLPGPGLLMMLGGLSLLAGRFAFARRWLGFAQNQVDRFRSRLHLA